jgi:hypothetical protein
MIAYGILTPMDSAMAHRQALVLRMTLAQFRPPAPARPNIVMAHGPGSAPYAEVSVKTAVLTMASAAPTSGFCRSGNAFEGRAAVTDWEAVF